MTNSYYRNIDYQPEISNWLVAMAVSFIVFIAALGTMAVVGFTHLLLNIFG